MQHMHTVSASSTELRTTPVSNPLAREQSCLQSVIVDSGTAHPTSTPISASTHAV